MLGALAQLGERLICIQEVSGSIPLGSTKTRTEGPPLLAWQSIAWSANDENVRSVKQDQCERHVLLGICFAIACEHNAFGFAELLGSVAQLVRARP